MRFYHILLVAVVFVTCTTVSTAKGSAATTISSVTSSDLVGATDTDSKRFLRAQDDIEEEEERAINFKSLTKNLKGIFKSKPKLTEVKVPMPNAKQLEMMAYRADIAQPFFKAWDEMNLPLTNVVNIVKNAGIAEDFWRYKQIAMQGRLRPSA